MAFKRLADSVGRGAGSRRQLSEEEVARLEANMTLLSPVQSAAVRAERFRLQR